MSKATTQAQFDAAVAKLDSLICAGWEWPDATAKVAVLFNMGQDELAEAYDQWVEEECHAAREAEDAKRGWVEFPHGEFAPQCNVGPCY